MAMARFSIACQRKGKNAGADFIGCVAYGKNAETLQKWFGKGKGIEIKGHIQTGSYDKNGTKVYTTDVIVDEIEFAKVRKGEDKTEPTDTHTEVSEPTNTAPSAPDNEGFMSIPEVSMDELPFK